MDAEEIARTIGDLENRVERLRSLYDQYFMGIERIEPLTMRKDVDRRLWALRREQIRNTGLRFKLETTIQRYNTYQQYWQRIVREIEAGTYQRDLGRAAKRFGDNAVTAFAKRRAKMFEKGLERKSEREARRTGAAGSSLAPPPGEEAAPQSEAIDVEFVEDTEPATGKHVAEPAPPLELEMSDGLSSEPPPIPHTAEQRRGLPAAPSPSRGTAPNAPNAPIGPSIPRPAAPGSPPLAPPRAPLPSVTGQPGTPPPRAPLPSTTGQPAAQPPARAPVPSGGGQGLPPPRAPLPSHMGQAGPPRAPLPSTTGQPLPLPRATLASSTGQPPLARGPGAPSPVKPATPVATPAKPATPAAATPATAAKPAFAASAPTRPSPTAVVSPARSAAGAPVAPTPAAVARPAVVAAKPPPAPFEKPPPARAPAPSVSDAARPPAVLSEDNTLSPIRMRQIYGQFVEAKRKANESTAAVTYEKIAANLENAAKELRAKHKARSVDFEVVMKNGKPVLKPVVKG